ncbi:hypothetical protein EK904_011024 [Melospiza melodia maxima]|nr:hypothetical protein EK904_011024 [Melospiza melodia maxima]
MLPLANEEGNRKERILDQNSLFHFGMTPTAAAQYTKRKRSPSEPCQIHLLGVGVGSLRLREESERISFAS